MINNYEIEFTKEELKQIIEAYFKEKYNEKIEFEIISKIEYTGFHDQQIAVTKYYGIKNIEIVGIKKTAKFELTESNIKEILTKIFDKYEIERISFESKIEYMDYTLPDEAKFKGIKLKIKLKEQQNNNSIINLNDSQHQRPQSMYDPTNEGGYYENWSLRR